MEIGRPRDRLANSASGIVVPFARRGRQLVGGLTRHFKRGELPFSAELPPGRRRVQDSASRPGVDRPFGETMTEATSRMKEMPALPSGDGDRRREGEESVGKVRALTVAEMTAVLGGHRGEALFRSILEALADRFEAPLAFLATVTAGSLTRWQTLLVRRRGEWSANFVFDAAGTDLAEILDCAPVITDGRLTDRWRGCAWLSGVESEAWVGIPLPSESRSQSGAVFLFPRHRIALGEQERGGVRLLASYAALELDRLRTVESLRASEERFRQLADQARDVLWALDLPSRRLAYLSPSFERITGVSPREVGAQAFRVLRLIDRGDRRRVFEALREALQSPGGGYAMEYRIQSREGGARWIFDQGVVIRDSSGRPSRISGVARDITSRKQAELALAAERGRFRDLFENSPDAIFVESFEGRVLDVNQAACDLHRLPRERLIGRHVTELVPEEAKGEVAESFARMRSGELCITEGLSLRSDGGVVPVEIRATPVELDEGRRAILLHVRDISARRRAEEYLAGQKRILEWIATGRAVGVVLSELVRVTEARQHGIRCWVHWFPDPSDPEPQILAPTFGPVSLPHLSALARWEGRIGELLAGTKGEPVTNGELLAESEEAARLQRSEQCRWATAVIMPVVARSGSRFGAVTAFLEPGVSAGEPLLDLLRLAASLAGVAIERHLNDALLREGAERLRKANSALLELARSELVSEGDLGASLGEIAQAAARGIGVDRVNIWFFEDNDTILRCVHHFEEGKPPTDLDLEIRVADFPSYFEAVLRDRFLSVADVETDPRTAELVGSYFRPLGVNSTLDAGIRLRGRLVGMICLEHQGSRRAWKNEEELFAGSLADIVALAVQAGERRCIEDALRQSEEAYRSVVGALTEGVMLVNRDGSFVTFNDSAAEILGLTADYLRNHRLAEASWDTVRQDGTRLEPEEYPAARTFRTGETFTDTVMGVRRPDGRLVWISINSRPFSRDEKGQVSSVVVSFADITRRQEAERALREGHELLQAISDVQALFIADPDPAATFGHLLERLVRMTDSLTGLIGEVFGTNEGTPELRIYAPKPGAAEAAPAELPASGGPWQQVAGEVMSQARAVIRSVDAPEAGDGKAPAYYLGLPLYHDEAIVGVVVLGRNGHPYDAAMLRRLEPLLLTCANVIGAIRIGRQRKDAEARIRQLNAELEQRVEERTADLRETNEELAEFAYVVTHDLKAPLRGIHQLSEWLSQDHSANLDDEGLRLLGLLRGRVKHLQKMIDGLLACARVARTPEPESSVATLQLVQEIATVLAPPPHIHILPAADLPTIWGNPDRLYQVFQNLLDNAVKYLDKPHGRVEVAAIRRRGSWEFRVSDNGPGIPERYQEKVFQIFQRLDPSGQIPGTGLGLTLVKRIVEARGGRIWIESRDGEGTTICFTWLDRARKRAVA